MSLIWDKGNASVDEAIMRFTAGDDVLWDRQLFVYDIRGSIAHVRGLGRIGVLTEVEVEALEIELERLREDFEAEKFVLDETYEDGHSAIEARLIEKLGEVGKKVHTGRSRNDQILVAVRLYLRDRLRALREICLDLADIFLVRAEAEMMTPMPGYTHLQRAVPSSVGLWMAGFAEAFIDDAVLARATAAWVDANPLGTAAGYGVNVPLDRDGVSDELEFGRTQINPIYAQNSRGKFELQALDALGQALLDVRRFAWDLSIYTTGEFEFVGLPDAYTTGSSIMPNKRNPDVVELLRATYPVIQGARAELVSTLSLPSGYHRDLQNTKPALLRAMAKGMDALYILPGLVREMTFDRQAMADAISHEMYATDRAVELTTEGVPFREAYKQVAEEMDSLADRSPEQSLEARTSPGGPVEPRLDHLRRRLDATRS